MFAWRPFWTLIKRESWEYRDWWTWILGACVLMGIAGLTGLAWQKGLPSSDAHAFRDVFFLRWVHGMFLVGGSILALSHAAHGVFDERQDRSIGFWQAWPVSEKLRLLSKSTAIAAGWPLLAGVATTILMLFCLLRGAMTGEGYVYFEEVGAAWVVMMQACLFTAAWSWPIICGWLWCSARAPKSPWAWGLGLGLMLYAGGLALGVDGAPLALTVALGPVLPAAAGVLGKTAMLPWALGSALWVVSCFAGWLALVHAGRSIGDAAEA